MTGPIRILIADDHPVVRKGLAAILRDDAELDVIAEAGDGESALQFLREHTPDVAVLDVDMPKLDGFGVARESVRQELPTKLIFLTLHSDADFFQAAMDLGVQGYLLKDSAMLEIVTAIKTVAAGRRYLSSDMTLGLLQKREAASSATGDALMSNLTPTERRVLKLIGAGQSSKEIGVLLSIHYRTVENHRTNICRKLGIEGANALLRFALQNKNQP